MIFDISDDNVALVLGDNIFYGQSFSKLLLKVANKKEEATIFGYYVRDPREYGGVEFDENGKAISIEKTTISEGKLCSTGALFQ